jgi:hypothetical protein
MKTNNVFKMRDGAWWLVIIAGVLTALAYSLAVLFGYSSNLLIVFGLFSGVIYAMTNANDRRAVHGRAAKQEEKAFEEADYLAIAGLIGVLLTWLLMPVLYELFAAPLRYQSNWVADAKEGFLAPLVFIPQVPIPGAVFAGLFTIASTYAYLKFIGGKTLDYLGALLPLVLIADILVGIRLFDDTILSVERIIFTVMVFLFVGLSLFRPKLRDSAGDLGSKTKPYLWIVCFLVFTFLTDLSIRGSLYGIEPPRQFFVSLWFRAAYFSMFVVFFLYWWVKLRKEGMIAQLRKPGRMRLILVTPLTFSIAFALRVPLVANNLAVGPIVSFVGNILALSLVGVFYKTDGSSPELKKRFSQVYLREGGGPARFIYLALYTVFVLTIIVWLCVRFLS